MIEEECNAELSDDVKNWDSPLLLQWLSKDDLEKLVKEYFTVSYPGGGKCGPDFNLKMSQFPDAVFAIEQIILTKLAQGTRE
jgi:hypothetical protein